MLTNVFPHNSVSGPNPVCPYWPLQQRASNEVKGAGNDAISSNGRLLYGFVSGEGGYFGRIFLIFLYPSYIWEEAVAELGISHLIGAFCFPLIGKRGGGKRSHGLDSRFPLTNTHEKYYA